MSSRVADVIVIGGGVVGCATAYYLAKSGNNNVIVLEANENVEEATAALQILGYTKKEVEKALEHVSVENASVEEIIRKCLSIL